jgi:tetratricopeptide (TPR) repeat protein
MEKIMPMSLRSKILLGMLWLTSVALMGGAAYFGGWNAEAKFEDLNTTSAPELKLENQGRYEEAVQTVLDRIREGLREADADSEVAVIYLNRAKKDRSNREKWAQQAVPYLDKAAALAPHDPFILESIMDDFNMVGDYSENGCPHYEKAVQFGQAALALLQGNSVTVEGYIRSSYPAQPIRDRVEPTLKRIQSKVEACCKR